MAYVRHMRIMTAEKLAEFGTFSGKFHVMFGMWIKKMEQNSRNCPP